MPDYPDWHPPGETGESEPSIMADYPDWEPPGKVVAPSGEKVTKLELPCGTVECEGESLYWQPTVGARVLLSDSKGDTGLIPSYSTSSTSMAGGRAWVEGTQESGEHIIKAAGGIISPNGWEKGRLLWSGGSQANTEPPSTSPSFVLREKTGVYPGLPLSQMIMSIVGSFVLGWSSEYTFHAVFGTPESGYTQIGPTVKGRGLGEPVVVSFAATVIVPYSENPSVKIAASGLAEQSYIVREYNTGTMKAWLSTPQE